MQEKKWSIPAELAALPQWVCWGALGKARKCPYNRRTGYPAKAGQADTWADLATAAKAVKAGKYEGLGFEFSGGIVGVDFDHCIEDGWLNEWAAAWVRRFDSYTEISPSGTGLHIICKGKLPGEAVKRPRAELYDRGRYFTVTGKPWGALKPVREAQEAVNALYEELQAETRKAPDKPTEARTAPAVPPGEYLSTGLQRDGAFRALWEGGRPNGNESADDLALMNKLAFWCGRDAARMKAAFLASPHAAGKDEAHRKKLEREDYLQRTIDRAVKDCPETAAERDAAYKLDRARRDFALVSGDVFGRATPQEQPPPKISTISAPDLQRADLPPVQFIVQDILPIGTAMLSAASKIGKSWLVLDMGLKITAGEPFMGRRTTQCGVLYLALEDSLNRLQDRMNKILKGKPAPALFHFATEAPTLENGLISALDAKIAEHPEIRLVIIDTLQKVRGQAQKNEAAYAQDYREMGVVKSHFDKVGVGTFFVHHNRKMKDTDDTFNMISGTNGIMGAADTIWVITKNKRADEVATLDITGRDVQQSSTAIKFNKDAFQWETLGDADWLEEQRARLAYGESPIVKTVKRLLEQSAEKRWDGTAKELLEAGKYIAKAYLAPTPQKLGYALKPLDQPMFEYDGILHTTTGNGSGGKKHHFYYSGNENNGFNETEEPSPFDE